ncbi:MAG: anti-anti-sigma regulatory factor [Paraglaciecola psychrophila]|jgi:anti-anti-sigma regulatory factor
MNNKTSFSCGESLDIASVKSLQTRLQKSLQKSSIIELKADAVEKADTAGLQLFVALKNEIDKLGGSVVWKNPSTALINCAVLLGLDETLGLQ